MRAVLRAGLIGAAFSGAPSTLLALLTRTDPLEPSLAAGQLVLPDETRRAPLLLAAGGAHLVLSLGWAAVLARALPRRGPTVSSALAGAAAGALIAAVDLGAAHRLSSRRFAGVRGLPVLPQLADHLAFGALVGVALSSGPEASAS